MKFERFIARRYLFSGQNKALVSLITIISILGVALGVMALIIVTAVMDGFDDTLRKQIVGMNADIEVVRYGDAQAITTSTIEQIRALPGVKGVAPVIMRYALIQVPGEGNANRQTVVRVQGLDMDLEDSITNIRQNVEGNKSPADDEIVLGASAAEQFLQVLPGEEINLIIPQFIESAMFGRVPRMFPARVAGKFRTGFVEHDSGYAYMSLAGAERMFGAQPGQIDALRVMVKDQKQLENVANDIRKITGNMAQVTTWISRNENLFNVLVLEKWAMFIILLLIVLVAAFNIIGTLTMVVTDKTREIGIMKSMGAPESAILRIFRNQGLFIGGIGTAIGASLGLFTCYMLKYHIRIPQLKEAYMSEYVPVLIDPFMVVLIIVSAMLICLLASLYPARQAAKLDPVEALRYE